MMQVAVIGVGAMGCLFGAYLSPLADVTLLTGAAETPQFSESGPSRVVQLGIIDVLCTYYLLDQQAV